MTAFMPDVVVNEQILQGVSSPFAAWSESQGCDCEGAIVTRKCQGVSCLNILNMH